MQSPGVDPSVSLVFEHTAGNGSNKKQATPQNSSKLRLPSGIRVAATTFDSPNVLKSEFDKLVQSAQDAAAKHVRVRK